MSGRLLCGHTTCGSTQSVGPEPLSSSLSQGISSQRLVWGVIAVILVCNTGCVCARCRSLADVRSRLLPGVGLVCIALGDVACEQTISVDTTSAVE